MKSNSMVYTILVFGILVSIGSPYFINAALKGEDKVAYNEKELSTSTEYTSNLAAAIPSIDEAITVTKDEEVPVINEPVVNEPVVNEPVQAPAPEPVTNEVNNVPTKDTVSDPIVYGDMTMTMLTDKLNRVLKSDLAGTGGIFAKYAVEYGIDPYVAVAISLHETGCNGKCSTKVTQCNNVGGMKGSPSCNGGSYKYFDTLDAGINAFMYNLKVNYYDKGLTTLEQMNKKYAASTTWAVQVNRYVEMIMAA